MDKQKITSVLELAHFQVGSVGWWVVLRPSKSVPDLAEEDSWMRQAHSKILYKSGPYKKLWPARVVLPKLQQADFNSFVTILTSNFQIEQFTVCDIIRSKDTGEFYYSNDQGEWVPQDSIFDTKIAADRERSRILKMLRKWTEQ